MLTFHGDKLMLIYAFKTNYVHPTRIATLKGVFSYPSTEDTLIIFVFEQLQSLELGFTKTATASFYMGIKPPPLVLYISVFQTDHRQRDQVPEVS
jgi:hypothetical protein